MENSWAKPGVEVVCVCDKFRTIAPTSLVARIYNWLRSTRDPRRGQRFIIAQRLAYGSELYLKFSNGDPHSWYDARAFRPLVTRSQEYDVALFAPILHGQPVEA